MDREREYICACVCVEREGSREFYKEQGVCAKACGPKEHVK